MNDFLSAAGALAQTYQAYLLTAALCMIRLQAAFLLIPATGSDYMPGMVRNGVVAVIALFVAGGQPPDALRGLDSLSYAGIALKESLIGLLMGFMTSTVFWAVESVGALIDMQAGFNNVQLTNPMSEEQSTPVSGLLLQLTVTVFWVLGGMLVFVRAFFESFKIWPLMSAWPSAQGLSDALFLGQIDQMMRTVVKFGAPALLVLMLIDLGFGLVTKAADKLQPTSLSQPVKGAVTLLLLALMTAVLLSEVRRYVLPLDLLAHLRALLGGH